jgi:hypothetical protein
MKNSKPAAAGGKVLAAFVLFAALAVAAFGGAVRYKIVYTSNPDGNNDIFVLIMDENLNRLETRRLTDWPSTDYIPCWSKDGKWIAFMSNHDGDYDIWIMDEFGGQKRRISSTGGFEMPFAWSLDGQTIYANLWGQAAGFDVQSGVFRNLTQAGGYNTQSFDLNGGQTSVAYVRGAAGNGWTNQLYVADFASDGIDFLNIRHLPAAAPSPHWPRRREADCRSDA